MSKCIMISNDGKRTELEIEGSHEVGVIIRDGRVFRYTSSVGAAKPTFEEVPVVVNNSAPATDENAYTIAADRLTRFMSKDEIIAMARRMDSGDDGLLDLLNAHIEKVAPEVFATTTEVTGPNPYLPGTLVKFSGGESAFCHSEPGEGYEVAGDKIHPRRGVLGLVVLVDPHRGLDLKFGLEPVIGVLVEGRLGYFWRNAALEDIVPVR